MNTHKIGNINIDYERAISELERSKNYAHSEAYSDFLCGGPWRSILLWSFGGINGDGFITNYDRNMPAAITPYGKDLSYLSQIIEDNFDTSKLTFARVARMPAGSVIMPHKDMLEIKENFKRVHIPIVTDEDCLYSEDDAIYRMRCGEVWYFESTKLHSVASLCKKERIHLLLDFEEVDESDHLFKFEQETTKAIPLENQASREMLSKQMRDQVNELSKVINFDNFREVISIVVKTHFRFDGGSNYIWDTLLHIAKVCENKAIGEKLHEMHHYMVIKRNT
ncbi:aspartyl/asparaginyl beta-hydroxylase domain-containing protein [Pseudoalteromonas luteoviolacea]|uniref:Aspartyl/asparaginy/proline hydroxylase domain-containing protein n=1 Tax=Pseudoalteromonas luteoviolacea NCIMB 1942 TaxID=1365253 RepID=A0A167CLL6_9GAMM|nr:aspartyl/asparaginyl beta-hydroxylase domain-containing protein [Pseudoalteromonas luteoviolacea]KZN47808.1 hypothetical protein N482_08835 [Pseudoalteromonas luteoviolacea NCIMB 1942]